MFESLIWHDDVEPKKTPGLTKNKKFVWAYNHPIQLGLNFFDKTIHKKLISFHQLCYNIGLIVGRIKTYLQIAGLNMAIYNHR